MSFTKYKKLIEYPEHSHLISEWSPKNSKSIEDVTPGSRYRALWICFFGHEWISRIPDRLKGDGHGCPICYNRDRSNIMKKKKSNISLLSKIEEFSLIIEEYRGEIPLSDLAFASHIKVPWECKKCQHIWTTAVKNRTLGGNGCPRCSSSKLEKKVCFILKSHSIPFEEQYRLPRPGKKRPLTVDFLIEYNDKFVAVECQGKQHYDGEKFFGASNPEEGFRKVQQHDIEKKKILKMLNIPLIEVRYDEKDIEAFLGEQLAKYVS